MWRYKRFHYSYMLGWLATGSLLGLMLGKYLTIGYGTFLLFIALILILGALRSCRWWAVAAIFVAGMILGVLRGSETQQAYGTYDELVGGTVTLIGKMAGDAQRRNSQQVVTLTDISISNRKYVGDVYVTVFSSAILKRGDTLSVEGKLKTGFASYGVSLTSGKILTISRGSDPIRDIRERFSEVIRADVMEPMASLGLGFVVGQRSALPDSLDEQLKVVGLTHIVVASGYNLTILVRFVMRLLGRHSRYLAFMTSLIMIMLFVLFSGFSPSMNRAVIVTVLGLLAWYVGRRFHPLLLILYVAAGTALFNPMYVWADLGWYLSFFAFAGILIIAPLVLRALYRKRDPSAIEQLVAETMSAEIMALPLIAFAFGAVPVYALLANVLVGPFIPVAMALTALTGILGIIGVALTSLIALPTMILIGYMVAVIEWLASLPGASWHISMPLWVLLLWYGLMSIGAYWLMRKLRYDFRARDSGLEI